MLNIVVKVSDTRFKIRFATAYCMLAPVKANDFELIAVNRANTAKELSISVVLLDDNITVNEIKPVGKKVLILVEGLKWS